MNELMSWEIFFTLHEVRILIGNWGRKSNQVSPHSAWSINPLIQKVSSCQA
jgi:hypothetical protein